MTEMWQLISEITLGSALTIVGTVAVVLAFIYRWFGKEKEWEDPILDCNKRIDGVERRIDKLAYPQQHYDKQLSDVKDDVRKQEEKIDRITNLLIEYFSSRQPEQSKLHDTTKFVK